MCSDLEKDKVFLTERAKRCLGQNGTFRACPLPDRVVEPFDVGCKTRLFTNGFVLFVRHNSLVGFPEIAVADALLVAGIERQSCLQVASLRPPITQATTCLVCRHRANHIQRFLSFERTNDQSSSSSSTTLLGLSGMTRVSSSAGKVSAFFEPLCHRGSRHSEGATKTPQT